MTCSESELGSNFVINSVSDFDSESDSESDFGLAVKKSRHLYFLYSILAFL